MTRIRRLHKTGAAKCAKAACCFGIGWRSDCQQGGNYMLANFQI
jgi:hypothetical protein